MVALFALMTVPMIGWYFLGDLTAHGLWQALPAAQQELLLEVQKAIRFKLALVLGASIAALAAVVLYLRRSVLDRLERLAAQARRAHGAPWAPQLELAEPDEIGDLARALEGALERLEERADEAARFAHNLSHELRTPLAAIRGAAELLTDPGLSAAERQRFSHHVLAESERMERLVTALLELARAEGRTAEGPAPGLLLPEAVRSLTGPFEALAAEAGVRLAMSTAGDLPPVAVHPDLLHRALAPLLENALSCSPRGSELLLRLEQRGETVLIGIEDEGPGVATALRERVFERGFTADVGGVPRHGGGLGLAIARRAADRLGGRVWVEEAPAGGARFVLCLPAATPPPPPAKADQPPDSA